METKPDFADPTLQSRLVDEWVFEALNRGGQARGIHVQVFNGRNVLRWIPEDTVESGETLTFRIEAPIREGDRLRISYRFGDGPGEARYTEFAFSTDTTRLRRLE